MDNLVIEFETLLNFTAGELVGLVHKFRPDLTADDGAGVVACLDNLMAGHDLKTRLLSIVRSRLGLV